MITTFLKQQGVAHHNNQGITICSVSDAATGINLTKDLLYHVVDKRTILYLSGGKTPKSLYTQLAQEGTLLPGAVGLVDERCGEKFHPTSNEKMINETELLRYLSLRNIPFDPILQSHPEFISGSKSKEKLLKRVQHDSERQETAELYDQKMRELTTIFPKSIAIMGLGSDGHTSGIAPNRKDFTNPMFDPSQKKSICFGI
jgi:6-phosphogluconolactonase/glucosamine-6-phosphate isomerase/deaminase